MNNLLTNRLLAVLLLLALATPSRVHAAADDSAKPDAKSDNKSDAKFFEEPPLSVTPHSITLGGRALKYHATAGYIVLKEEEGKPLVQGPVQKPPSESNSETEPNKTKDGLKPKAKVFFVAYTLDDVSDPATRPLTFAFNGGPGSSSVWLHMASVAPRRANLTDEGEAPPPPYRLTDNESTWLDLTDLVFIDPVSTGYSRPVAKESPNQYHGLKEDIASVGDFIRLYASRNTRWLSPKFILGESYGTTRAAGLSDYLQDRYGLYFNGIILVSSALNFQALEFSPQNNDPYIQFLPSYTASAWYHKKLPADIQAKSVAEVVAASRTFAAGDYATALARGDLLSADDKTKLAGELSRYTGLPASDLLLWKLRVKDTLFFTHLLRAEGKMLGRLDARFSGVRYEPGTDGASDGEYDPSSEAVNGPLGAAFNDYVRRELKFESDLPYELRDGRSALEFRRRRQRLPQHRRQPPQSHDAQSLPENMGDLQLLRSRHALLRRGKCRRFHESRPSHPRQPALFLLRVRPHALHPQTLAGEVQSRLRILPQRRHQPAPRPQRRARRRLDCP